MRKPSRVFKRAAFVCFALALVGLIGASAAVGLVRSTAQNRVYTHVRDVPHHRVAIVLGCSPVFQGSPNPYFLGRISAAAELYKAKAVERILVSGDNGRVGYDEPTAMREGLIQLGVPAAHVVCDFAGFRTFDTMARAHDIFGLKDAVVVTDRFHMARCLYLAEHQGIDAVGYPSRTFVSAAQANLDRRELAASVEAVLDCEVYHSKPKYLGPREEIP